MAERHNSGTAWFNREPKSEKHPQFGGSVNVDGVEYFIDIWVKDSTKYEGEKWLSLAVKRKDKQPERSPTPSLTPTAATKEPTFDVPL